MDRVIVTVAREGEAQARDLDLPADVPAGELAALVAAVLQWNGLGAGYTIRAVPPGRVLGAHETLLDAGVWDGARLIFEPATSAPKIDTI